MAAHPPSSPADRPPPAPNPERPAAKSTPHPPTDLTGPDLTEPQPSEPRRTEPDPTEPAPATLVAQVAATSGAVAATAARTAKVDLLAELLRRLQPAEVPVVVAWLSGELPQGRVGVGWSTVAGAPPARAARPTTTVADLDATFTALAHLAGPGSQVRRDEVIARAFADATEEEGRFLSALLTGEQRQGAAAGVMTNAVAKAWGLPLALVRRAAMLAGDLATVAGAASAHGPAAVAAIGLVVGRPVQPMLAASSPTVAEALTALDAPAVVEWKLDGIRVQVHRRGEEVHLWTRNLNEITDRLGPVVDLVRTLPVDRVVLDGEVLGIGDDDAPALFQDTMRTLGTDAATGLGWAVRFFDVLHLDGRDLLDEPLAVRLDLLEACCGDLAMPGLRTVDRAEAQAFADDALSRGHEGVMVKDLASPYAAGRRGKTWRKVKPVRTLDLVVLAAEWGHGRRTGRLSNLHLGARSEDRARHPSGFVMVGKTFKGLSDELLAWQTEALLVRATGPTDRLVVEVRPELVVEIALDGVQRSTRYPGGVALRFARVRGYRPDRAATDADTIENVRALLASPQRPVTGEG